MKKTIAFSITIIAYIETSTFCMHDLSHLDGFTILTDNLAAIPVVEKMQEAEKLSHYKEQEIFAAKESIAQKENMEEFSIQTPHGLVIPATFFNRNSNKLLVVGQGFQNPKERVYFVARLFHDYDIVVFDYRWNNMLKFFLKPSTLAHPLQQSLLNEKEEILAVVDHIKQRKKYESITGHGICYSTFTLLAAQLEAQKEGKKLFDNLILDSCFLSSSSTTEKLLFDPCLIIEPQVDHTPRWVRWLLKITHIPALLTGIIRLCAQASIPSLLSEIKDTPILFVHGKKDVLIPLETEFKEIWQSAASTPKFALITPFPHVKNMLNRGLYKYVCEAFIQQKPEEFAHLFPVDLKTS